MGEFTATFDSYLSAFGEIIKGIFDTLFDAYELLETAISLPVEMSLILPGILSASIIVVLFIMIVKFIVGR